MHSPDNKRKSDKGWIIPGGKGRDIAVKNGWSGGNLYQIEQMLALLYQQKWTNIPDGNVDTSRISCCNSIFHVLPFCSFPYIQISIYPSFSKNGFEYLIFPSNKAGALINIAKPYLRHNLLWVSSRQQILELTDIGRAIHLFRGALYVVKKISPCYSVLCRSVKAPPRLGPNLKVTMKFLKEPWEDQ